MRLFIVEDHPFMRQMLRDFLEASQGFDVCDEADSAEAALEKLRGAELDLVLIDMSLPGMNGLELVERLHEREPQLRCAILSGHGEPSYADRAFLAGASGYIVKGDPDSLPEAIRQIVRGERYVSPSLMH